jgi:uncharacterized NAD(P)/FAD-binding protein YdhS
MAVGGRATVVIVGGGCSGTLLAAELIAASTDSPCEVVVVDPGETPGRGVAYGTRFASHLLNVPAEQMSAHVERPEHFVRWAHERDPRVTERSFAPRMLYGEYLESVWREAQVEAPHGSSLVHVRSTVTSIDVTGATLRVGLGDGTAIDADHVVLAMGNLTPQPSPAAWRGLAASPRYVADPWRPGALDDVEGSVLLIGTGLTAVDVAFALADRSAVGTIRAVSRHGLLPRAHRPDTCATPPLTAAPAERSVRGLLAMLRRNAAERGDWRRAVDEFRPHVADIWRLLPDAERRRFLRHAARFWEIHRHRMAPEVAQRVERLLAAQQLCLTAGSIEGHRDVPDGVEVSVRRRGTAETDVFAVSTVVNCTGPQLSIRAAADPLIDALLLSGFVRPGPFGLGLDVTRDGAAIDAFGFASDNLWAIGPLRRGVEWETTAAREIRAQAVAMARMLSRPGASVTIAVTSPDAPDAVPAHTMPSVTAALAAIDVQQSGVLR